MKLGMYWFYNNGFLLLLMCTFFVVEEILGSLTLIVVSGSKLVVCEGNWWILRDYFRNFLKFYEKTENKRKMYGINEFLQN